MSILFSKIILPFLLPVALAQTGGQWDLLNLFEQFKTAKPNITRPYQLSKIPEAWAEIASRRPGLNPVTIGIPDTGIDSLHPEFDNVVLFSDSLDLAGVLRGGHGTQVAGIIGANNISFGGTYTAPQMNGLLSGARNLNYKLMGKRVLNLRFGQFERFLLSVDKVSHVAALDELMKSNPDIVNISFGGIYNSPGLFENDKELYEKIFNDHPDTLFIAGAGNDSVEVSKFLPAAIELSNVITTGATSLDDRRASFSNFGSTVSISAPGIGIYAPAPQGKGNFPEDTKNYDQFFRGTSASAPMVTGVAGLIKAVNPTLTPAQIKQILIETADLIQTDKPIGPRLNAEKAVCHPLVLDCAPPPPPPPPAAPIWPMFQKDAQRSGFADVAGPPFATSTEVNVKWQKSSALFPLIGGDGTVYYVDFENKLTAVDGETGAVKWQALVPGSAFSSAIGLDGTLYVCSDGSTIPGTLTAFNPAGGQEKWRFVVGGPRPCLHPAVAKDGIIYTSAPPVQNAQTAVAVAINPDGTQTWRYEEFNFSASPPALSRDESQVYVAFNNRLLAFDAKAGLILWEQISPLSFLTLPVVDPEERIFIVGPPFFAGGPAVLHAFTKSGAPLWNISTFGLHFIALAPGNKIVAVHDSILRVIDRTTGAIVASIPLSPGFTSVSHPIVDANGVLCLIVQNISTLLNRLVAFDVSGLRWELEIPSLLVGENGIALGSEGTLYFSTSGILTALGL